MHFFLVTGQHLDYTSKNPFLTHPHAGCAGWLHVLFPVTVIAEKSNYTEARQEKSTFHHRSAYFT